MGFFVLEGRDLVSNRGKSIGRQLVLLIAKENLFKSLVNWSTLENCVWMFL